MHAFLKSQSGKKSKKHHTHQTVLYVQCVIGCTTKEMTLQCGQSVLFNLYCTSIYAINFASPHCTHLHTFRSGISVVSHHFCTMISIFCTTCPETPTCDRKWRVRLQFCSTPLRRQQPCPLSMKKGKSLFSSKMDYIVARQSFSLHKGNLLELRRPEIPHASQLRNFGLKKRKPWQNITLPVVK